MFVLSANREMITTDFDNDSSVITCENAETTEWRCVACGETVSEVPDGFADESGSLTCENYDPDDDSEKDTVTAADEFGNGPHRGERVALSWANSAAIHTDPDDDSITVTISVGDPRGAFAFTLRRVSDEAETNPGQLILHTPYPGEPMPHASLTPAHAGSYWVGSPA